MYLTVENQEDIHTCVCVCVHVHTLLLPILHVYSHRNRNTAPGGDDHMQQDLIQFACHNATKTGQPLQGATVSRPTCP